MPCLSSNILDSTTVRPVAWFVPDSRSQRALTCVSRCRAGSVLPADLFYRYFYALKNKIKIKNVAKN